MDTNFLPDALVEEENVTHHRLLRNTIKLFCLCASVIQTMLNSRQAGLAAGGCVVTHDMDKVFMIHRRNCFAANYRKLSSANSDL